MNKPGIFAAIAVVIIGAIAIWAASTASKPYASFGEQTLPMMAHIQGPPVQRIADFNSNYGPNSQTYLPRPTMTSPAP